MVGRVERYLEEARRTGPLHLTLIDPEKSPGERAGDLARVAAGAGTHGFLLGGSTGVTPERAGAAARAIKRETALPVVLFPEGPGSLTPEADAVLFMSLLNSRNLDWVIRHHVVAAPLVRRMGLEAIPMAYLVVEPGMKVGEVGQADPLPREQPERAAAYALAGEMLGMRYAYLEAGSGAPSPVPEALVQAVRRAVSLRLIVGGGIRRAEEARRVLAAGADIVVTGTIAEAEGVGPAFREIVQEVRRYGGR